MSTTKQQYAAILRFFKPIHADKIPGLLDVARDTNSEAALVEALHELGHKVPGHPSIYIDDFHLEEGKSAVYKVVIDDGAGNSQHCVLPHCGLEPLIGFKVRASSAVLGKRFTLATAAQLTHTDAQKAIEKCRTHYLAMNARQEPPDGDAYNELLDILGVV